MKDYNNIYLIKRWLADLKRVNAWAPYIYNIGSFQLDIYTYNVGEAHPDMNDSIVKHDIISEVFLHEISKKDHSKSIRLTEDHRFTRYTPIMYNIWEGPNGKVNLSDGRQMPLITLCELVKYLYRLSNLTVFM